MNAYLINNKQMHITYKLLFFLLFIILLIFKSNHINNNTYTNTNTNIKVKIDEIPEVAHYKNQTLKLFIPSDKCLHLFPKTIYFTSKYRSNNESKNIKIENVNLNEKNKSYFVTYIMRYGKNFENYYEVLNSSGMIESSYRNYSHNLFINALTNINFFHLKDKVIINEFQKQYSFLYADEFYNKDILYKNYIAMKKLFKNDYNYMSESYCYPRDQSQINTKFNNYTLDLNNLWLIKPINKSVGSGIHFLSSLKKEIKNSSKFLITKFITNLDLIDNKKYDLRLYALITGLKPLRLYFYKKGLVRKAVSVFNISKVGIHNRYMYLTNTGVNMKNKEYIYPCNSDDANANIWNLDTYRYYLKSKNVDFNVIFEKIKDITIKSVISFQKKLLIHNKDINDRNVYTLLGIDILITDNFEPILLEVNNRPSMAINDKVDKPIKTGLFADTLNIAGVSLFSRRKHNIKLKRNYIKDSVNNALCELYRPRGDYELIFPLNKNIEKYKKFFIKNNKENILFWEKIKLMK